MFLAKTKNQHTFLYCVFFYSIWMALEFCFGFGFEFHNIVTNHQKKIKRFVCIKIDLLYNQSIVYTLLLMTDAWMDKWMVGRLIGWLVRQMIGGCLVWSYIRTVDLFDNLNMDMHFVDVFCLFVFEVRKNFKYI